jgi:tetratricopeptide (TPR) repeat protein
MSSKKAALLVVVTAIVVAAGWVGWKWTHRPWHPQSPEVTTPQLAVAALRGPRVFFTPSARVLLLEKHPEFVPEGTKNAFSDVSRRMTQAAVDPQLFRELDRTIRFSEIWLVGEPSSYKGLLEHLIQTKDFGVTYLDHTSIILRRDAGDAWQPADPEKEAQRFADSRERAYVLAQVATRLVAIHRPDAATRWLKLAEASSTDLPDVWTAWATQRMAKADWDEALKYADRALALDSEFLPGIACKAQALYATKQFNAAYNLSKRLLAATPDDPGLLFYHAKLAHEARAFDSEIEALQHLIDLAGKAGANVSGYRVYLAQAYAAGGNADGAMDQVTLALLDTSLPREQRKFADELLTQIKKADAKGAAEGK